MTTNIKISTNGNYVCEVKNSGGTVIGKSGPGSMVESGSIYLPHGETFTISERDATAEELAALNGTNTGGEPAPSHE
jgi:hypothetical protein